MKFWFWAQVVLSILNLVAGNYGTSLFGAVCAYVLFLDAFGE